MIILLKDKLSLKSSKSNDSIHTFPAVSLYGCILETGIYWATQWKHLPPPLHSHGRMVVRQREAVWGRTSRRSKIRGSEQAWLQISREWTEVSFSYWQPLRDNQREMWPRSQLLSSSSSWSSSSFPPFPFSVSVESLYPESPCLPIWSDSQDMGSGAHCVALFLLFPVCLLAGPASEPQNTGPSDGR